MLLFICSCAVSNALAEWSGNWKENYCIISEKSPLEEYVDRSLQMSK